MAPETARRLWLPRERLPENIQVFNVDGTLNKVAWITHSVTATYKFGTKDLMDTFLLSGLGKEDIILGLPWLQKYNPDVNWKSGEVLFRPKQYIKIPHTENIFDNESPEEIIQRVNIRAKMSVSQTMAHQVEQKEQTFETLVPEYLHEFKAQFEDKEAERFPISQHYDHAIELKPDFVAKDCKLYSLTTLEQRELDKFLDENL
uniref:Pro-pol protein n=1 Tax=Moniliophthora roreri TaxID=221103 RepID=A0A0W0F729_MONRR